ncbi:hypothetical protein CARUB_v10012588mg [Capsella rubella]|uniref:Uncharacterized protein n=1 Tax=Capsella rubella TaxID=81985 RepID=R0I1N7_9BRAS|nr:hypothetical protein CARUB_v10012588mg [Capsella rubella]
MVKILGWQVVHLHPSNCLDHKPRFVLEKLCKKRERDNHILTCQRLNLFGQEKQRGGLYGESRTTTKSPQDAQESRHHSLSVAIYIEPNHVFDERTKHTIKLQISSPTLIKFLAYSPR